MSIILEVFFVYEIIVKNDKNHNFPQNWSGYENKSNLLLFGDTTEIRHDSAKKGQC